MTPSIMNKMLLSSWSCLTWLVLFTVSEFNTVASYPLISELRPKITQCFQYSIPQGDDASMVFLAVPDEVESAVEAFFIDQIVRMNKERKHPSAPLPRDFSTRWQEDDTVSEAIKGYQTQYSMSTRSKAMLRITKPGTPRPLRQQEFQFFRPVILNNVEKFQKARGGSTESYQVCFENTNEKNVHVYFEFILMSQHEVEEPDASIMTKVHLSPLEADLAATIDAATSIVSEMKYMERREERMLLTTKSINGRVRTFSYISVGVLLIATYLQVSYLKGYFKKKKLM